VTLPWLVVIKFAAMAAAGVIAGGSLAGRLSPRRLQQAFAVCLMVLACYMLVRR